MDSRKLIVSLSKEGKDPYYDLKLETPAPVNSEIEKELCQIVIKHNPVVGPSMHLRPGVKNWPIGPVLYKVYVNVNVRDDDRKNQVYQESCAGGMKVPLDKKDEVFRTLREMEYELVD
jgi:hypothetical protein